MNDSAIFQGLTRAWSVGAPPTAWPAAAWKNTFFECPVAVASHLQRFLARQAQEQVQLLAELARDPNPATAIPRQTAYLQQSALAWNTELLELAELVQGKLLAPVGNGEASQEKPPFPRAA